MEAGIDAVRAMAEQVLRPMGVELIEVEWIGARTARTLRLVVDRDGGVSADVCAMISRQFDLAWEAENEARRDFGLDVTSPGPNRPLVTERDFRRIVGRWVDAVYTDEDDVRVAIIAQVEACEDGVVTFAGFEEPVRVPVERLDRAKVLFTIGKPPTPNQTYERRNTRT